MKRDAPPDRHVHVCPRCQHLHRLFNDVWRVLLDPFLSGTPEGTASDAAEGVAYLLHRTGELLEGWPKDAECAKELLRHSIRRTKKYTRYKHSRLKIYEGHLAGELEANRRRSGAVASVAHKKGRRR
jgi:hypothetical protein